MRRLLLVAALSLAPAVTRADAVVRLCLTDVQAPASSANMNLALAIQAGGTITFACSTGAITIKMTQSHDILRDTRIEGAGRVTLDGGGVRRLGMFHGLDERRWLTLVDLRIVYGGDPKPSPLGTMGGVVHGRLDVRLIGTVVGQSASPILLRSGSVHIWRSAFVGNSGTAVTAPNVEIFEDSRFVGNTRPVYSRGGRVLIDHGYFQSNRLASYFRACTLRVVHSEFLLNLADGRSSGGAINTGCETSIEESELRGNTATFGGAIYVTYEARNVSLRAVKLRDNSATMFGGAIYAEFWGPRLLLALRHVSFIANRARQGGAIEFEGYVDNDHAIDGAAVSFVRNLAATNGGAIHMTNAGLRLARGVFVRNAAGRAGGAIAATQQGTHATELANTLVVKNRADSGGGFWGNGATFINTTIADNGSGAVTAVAARPVVPASPYLPKTFPIRFLNSLVSNDFTSPCATAVASAPYRNLGHNLQFPGASCGADIDQGYPALGPRYVPLFFSAALDRGDAAVCDKAPISRKDFFDVRRPLRTACAIGAAEGNVSFLEYRKRPRSRVPDVFSSLF